VEGLVRVAVVVDGVVVVVVVVVVVEVVVVLEVVVTIHTHSYDTCNNERQFTRKTTVGHCYANLQSCSGVDKR